MNTASILIKTDPQLKIKAQKTAQMLGLSLTSVVNHYLKDFIATKTITFDTGQEKLSEWAIKALRQSEKDVKAGRVIRFNSPKEALDYLDREIADERQKRSSD